jgi:hypothetical protein
LYVKDSIICFLSAYQSDLNSVLAVGNGGW